MNCELVVKNIRETLADYVTKNDIQALVIGVSGGIDSCLCCALARPVCDKLGIRLIGRSITIDSNKEDEIRRARDTGQAFCHNFLEIDASSLYYRECDFFSKHMFYEVPFLTDHEWKVARGNLKARMRMKMLFYIAGTMRGMVLSTDNLTEYYLGFWTLCGDVGDYGMIQNLWKTEVYELAKHIMAELHVSSKLDAAKTLDETIAAVPTDGLGITNSDLDQLGAPTYAEVDRILKIWLCFDEDTFHDPTDTFNYPGRPETFNEFRGLHRTFIDHPVVQRYERTHYKRDWPITIRRKDLFEE